MPRPRASQQPTGDAGPRTRGSGPSYRTRAMPSQTENEMLPQNLLRARSPKESRPALSRTRGTTKRQGKPSTSHHARNTGQSGTEDEPAADDDPRRPRKPTLPERPNDMSMEDWLHRVDWPLTPPCVAAVSGPDG